ncbi:MAG: hypothetical protein ACL93V_12720 [Candidatus Electrothrix sp. YB6]
MSNIFNAIIAGLSISIRKIGLFFTSVIAGIKIILLKIKDFILYSINIIIDGIIRLCNLLIEKIVSLVNYLLRIYLSFESGVVKFIQIVLKFLIKIRWGCVIFTCLYGIWIFFGFIAFVAAIFTCFILWFIGRSSAEEQEEKWNERIDKINRFIENPLRYTVRIILIIVPFAFSIYYLFNGRNHTDKGNKINNELIGDEKIIQDRVLPELKKKPLQKKQVSKPNLGKQEKDKKKNYDLFKPVIKNEQDVIDKLPIPYYDYDACPFEGCVYRGWTVMENTRVRKEKDINSNVSFYVRKGETVTALTGVVVTLKPSKILVLNTYKIDQEITVKKGDILYEYTYLGEGFSKIWFKGKMYHDGIPINPTDFDILKKGESVWWIKIRNKEGKEGWTKEAEHFGNKDLFGIKNYKSLPLFTVSD